MWQAVAAAAGGLCWMMHAPVIWPAAASLPLPPGVCG
jgi:hypothetical protein